MQADCYSTIASFVIFDNLARICSHIGMTRSIQIRLCLVGSLSEVYNWSIQKYSFSGDRSVARQTYSQRHRNEVPEAIMPVTLTYLVTSA